MNQEHTQSKQDQGQGSQWASSGMQGMSDRLRGKIKETWGRLSDDDIALASTKTDQFLAKVQQAYGLSKEDAQKRFDELKKTSGSSDKTA